MRRLPEHGSVKSRWQLTFSDMSTLLLTFFVLLFGLSLLSSRGDERFKRLFPNLPGEGRLYPSRGNIITPIPGVPLVNLTEEELHLADDLSEVLRDYSGKGEVNLLSSQDRLTLSIGSSLLFPPNGTRLNPDGYTLLERVSEALRPLSQRILIEGHTDETISAKRTNQWLSLQRALAVLAFFRSKGFAEERLGVAGYGSSRPLFIGESPDLLTKNRRVEITLLLRRP